ncbi:neurotrimin [Xylocopa sonorina]|uniref:neurotrimin n=1 Tax=Xylocopa sonorina TaxID=1818115 RepID=UPI00403AB2EA
MHPLRFVGLFVILLAPSVWCKPAKSNEDLQYNDDDPSDYNEDEVEEYQDPNLTPQILSKPENFHVRTGSTIWLPCTLKDADQYAVTWRKNDELLYYDSNRETNSSNISRLPNNTLEIRNANPKDSSDNYECSILITPPVTIRHRVLVDAEGSKVPSPPPTPSPREPPIHVSPGKTVELKAGEDLNLGCETRIQPTRSVKWYHENTPVHNASGNYITIANVKRRDGGRYQCLIETGEDKPLVEEINVIINYPPEIETKEKLVYTGLGIESRLTCIVHAHPHAKVAWFKGQKEVTPKKGSIEIKGNKTRHILEILHTEKGHLGNYTCVAINRLGKAEKTISLTGLPSQAIISGGEMTKTGLILKWQLESYSPITEYMLRYRRKGDENWTDLKPTVTNGKGNQFTVEHVIEGLQPGSYEAILLARNDFGWSLPSAPHTFVGEYEDQQAENVKAPSDSASQHALSLVTLFLVVSSCAFTSL